MIHPVIVATWVADAVAVLLLFAAAVRAEPIVRLWAPAAATRKQLQLERALEAASLLARLGGVAFVVGSLVVLLAVTAALPAVVPGAMCGTGVVEAAEAEWPLLLRGLAVLALAAWATLDRLDRAAPRAPLARLSAALLLPAAPLAGWSAWQTARALGRLDGQSAVDCCAAMYAEVAPAAPAVRVGPMGLDGLLFAGAAGLIVAGGLWLARPGRGPSGGPARAAPAAALAVLTGAWILLAADVLVHHLAAYHYEVLAHRCPWCLFLPEHGAVGYVVFGALALAALEAVSILAAVAAARAAPSVARDAASRVRRAGVGIALAVLVFAAVAAGPALRWWWLHGVVLE